MIRAVFVRVCVVGFGWMVVRFVRVIRVPARAPVCPVCPVCVPAPPGVFLLVPGIYVINETNFFSRCRRRRRNWNRKLPRDCAGSAM